MAIPNASPATALRTWPRVLTRLPIHRQSPSYVGALSVLRRMLRKEITTIRIIATMTPARYPTIVLVSKFHPQNARNCVDADQTY